MNLAEIRAFAALLESKELPYEGDTPYTTRYIVRKTDAGSVYLQNIHREDRDPAMHSHPWVWMRTTVLHGGYQADRGTIHDGELQRHLPRYFRVGDSYEMSSNQVHVITAVSPDTWTLLFVGPKHDEWGFWIGGRGLVPWRERFKERGVRDRSHADL